MLKALHSQALVDGFGQEIQRILLRILIRIEVNAGMRYTCRIRCRIRCSSELAIGWRQVQI